jgi:hypothetical protein
VTGTGRTVLTGPSEPLDGTWGGGRRGAPMDRHALPVET